MKGLQIKCLAIGPIGEVKFLDENDVVVMEYKWVDEKVHHSGMLDDKYNEMTKIAESIRELAMKIGD